MKRRDTIGLGTAALLAAQFGSRIPLASARGEGGTFVFGTAGDPVGLDPAVVTDGQSLRFADQIFDTLITFNGSSTDLKPSLAKSWDVSADGLTYTMKLRSGVRFHDGTAFDATAVKWNFDRWGDTKNKNHVGGDFEYYSDVAAWPDVISSVDAVDDLTVRFNLKASQGPFLLNMALGSFSMFSPASFELDPENANRKPVGTGPYKFVEWVPGDKVVMEAYADYWGDVSNVDQVVVRTIPDNSARFLALKAGSIDMMDGVNPDDVATAKADRGIGILLRPPLNVAYINFNQTKKPFDDVRIRQAFSVGINRQAIVDALYGGRGVVANQMIPDYMLGFNTELKGFTYDVAAAKKLLADAGFPNGFTTEFWYMPVSRPYYPNPKQIAEAFAAELKKIGITAELKTKDWGAYLQSSRANEFPVFMLGWGGDNGDTDNFLFTFFGTDGGGNTWKNDEARKLLVKAQQSADNQERDTLYRQVNALIEKEVPRLPIAHTKVPLLARAYVKGYLPSPVGAEKFTMVWLDK